MSLPSGTVVLLENVSVCHSGHYLLPSPVQPPPGVPEVRSETETVRVDTLDSEWRCHGVTGVDAYLYCDPGWSP